MSFIRLSRIKFLQRTLQSGDSRVQSAAHFLQAEDGIIDLCRRFREVVAPLVCRDGHVVVTANSGEVGKIGDDRGLLAAKGQVDEIL